LKRLLWLAAAWLFAWIGPVAAKPALSAYGRLPQIEAMALSPAGDRFAYVAVQGEDRVVAICETSGKLLFSVPAGKAKVRNIDWAGDDHLLIFVTKTVALSLGDRDLYEGSQLFAVNVKTQNRLDVLSRSPLYPMLFGDFGTVELDHRWYGFFGAITPRSLRDGYVFDHGYPDLYRIDLDTGQTLQAARGGEFDRYWVVDGAGKVPAHSQFDTRSGLWRLFAGPQAGSEAARRSAPLGGVQLMGQGRTAGTVVVLDTTGPVRRLEERSLQAQGTSTELLAGEPVSDLLFDPVSRLLIGAVTTDEAGAILFDPKAEARLRGAKRAFPKRQMRLVSYTRDFGRMLVFTDGDDDSGTYWLVDVASGKASVLGSAYPDIKPADVAPTRLVAYKAEDGLDISAVLTLPPGGAASALPLVVLPHGGPQTHDRLGFDWWAQAFAHEGYAVLQPNFRGSDGRDAAFQHRAAGEWGRRMQTDLSDGVAFLAADGIVDPKRACIVGASYGGYAALAGVTVQHGLYRCAASVDGVSDLAAFQVWTERHAGSGTVATRSLDALLGKGDVKPISPIRLAAQADAPVLLVHGRDDSIVPPEQSQAMEKALRRAGKPVELLLLDGEDHWMSQGRTREQMLNAVVAFVEKYNPR
jgi:dienelactone hydrolase